MDHWSTRRSTDAAKVEWKTACLLCGLLFVLVLRYPSLSALEERDPTQGDFGCDHVTVSRINLSLKEIDVVLDVYVVVNNSFSMVAWIPETGGRTFWASGTPVQNSASWHEYHLREMPLDRVAITTIGHTLPAFFGMSPFPFEGYKAEMIFGFNVTVSISTGIKTRPMLSPDLEEGGVWNVTVETKKAEGLSSAWQDGERVVKEKGLKSFVSLSITLSHPSPYKWKMLIPAWGPLIFLMLLYLVQFCVVRARLSTGDHVALFIGAAVLVLGQSLSMREVTPPELTLPEFLSFSFTVGYLILLALIIRFKRSTETASQLLKTAADERIDNISKKLGEIGRLLQRMSLQIDSGFVIRTAREARMREERLRRPGKKRKTRQGKGKTKSRRTH